MSNDSTPTPRASDLRHVSPGDLHQHSNIRSDLELDDAFLTSIREQGVLVPIVAAEAPDGSLMIEQGHRRAAAARLAGLPEVPVVVLDAATAGAQRLLAQLSENSRRRQTSLSDEASAHQQLAAFGLSAEDVAATTGEDAAAVRAKRSLAGSTLPRASVDALTLEQAALVMEFEDDPGLQEELAALAAEGRTHEMARVAEARRSERMAAAAVEAGRSEWRARGYTVWSDVQQDGDHLRDRGWVGLYQLGIDPAAHVQCPGRAVDVNPTWDGKARTTEYCTDPEGNGHELPEHLLARRRDAAQTGQGTQRQDPDAQREKARQERRKVIAGNKAWRAAREVRREHVRQWLAGAAPKAAELRWLLEQVVRTGADTQYGRAGQRMDELGFRAGVLRAESSTTSYGGVRLTTTVDRSATLARVQAGLLAVVLADREHGLGDGAWRVPGTTGPGAEYLGFLRDHTGYDLGAIERYAIGEEVADADLPWAGTGTADGPDDPDDAGDLHDADDLDDLDDADGWDDGTEAAAEDDDPLLAQAPADDAYASGPHHGGAR